MEPLKWYQKDIDVVYKPITFRCKYFNKGCMAKLSLNKPLLRLSHELKCPYRPFKCPCCYERGDIVAVTKHIVVKHAVRWLPGDYVHFLIENALNPKVVAWYAMQTCKDKNFLLIFQRQSNEFYMTVMFMGTEEQAKLYLCCFDMKKEHLSMRWKAKAISIREVDRATVKLHKSFSFDTDLVTRFITKRGDLSIYVSISEVSK